MVKLTYEPTYGYSANKQQLLNRLSRAEGQVRGVARMVTDDVYCIEILTQITATQAALDKVALGLLRDHARRCLSNDDVKPATVSGAASAMTKSANASKAANTADKADELVNAIERMISR